MLYFVNHFNAVLLNRGENVRVFSNDYYEKNKALFNEMFYEDDKMFSIYCFSIESYLNSFYN